MTGPIRVRGIVYPPSFRRRLHVVVVESCVYCGTSHVHRSGSTGGVRRAGCGRGLYDVRPVLPRRRPGRAAA